MNIRCICALLTLFVFFQLAQAQTTEESVLGVEKGTLKLGSTNSQAPGLAFGEINFFHGGSYNQTFAAIHAERPADDQKAGLVFMTRNGLSLNKHMIINEVGQVGIGTMAPKAELEVNGKIVAKEIQCRVSDGADFVFESDYLLPPLEQVEAHIQAKGHLKDIPSATDMVDEGLSLGEMDVRLLQKVEELTLYLIEQNKKIKALEAQNRRLEGKMEFLLSK